MPWFANIIPPYPRNFIFTLNPSLEKLSLNLNNSLPNHYWNFREIYGENWDRINDKIKEDNLAI